MVTEGAVEVEYVTAEGTWIPGGAAGIVGPKPVPHRMSTSPGLAATAVAPATVPSLAPSGRLPSPQNTSQTKLAFRPGRSLPVESRDHRRSRLASSHRVRGGTRLVDAWRSCDVPAGLPPAPPPDSICRARTAWPVCSPARP